jgi:hypothetical protein
VLAAVHGHRAVSGGRKRIGRVPKAVSGPGSPIQTGGDGCARPGEVRASPRDPLPAGGALRAKPASLDSRSQKLPSACGAQLADHAWHAARPAAPSRCPPMQIASAARDPRRALGDLHVAHGGSPSSATSGCEQSQQTALIRSRRRDTLLTSCWLKCGHALQNHR